MWPSRNLDCCGFNGKYLPHPCQRLAHWTGGPQAVSLLSFSSLFSLSFYLSFFLLLSPSLPFLPSLKEINIFCFHITLLLGYSSAQTHGVRLPWTEPSEINSQSKHFLLLNYLCWLFYHTKSSEYLVPSEDQRSWATALRDTPALDGRGNAVKPCSHSVWSAGHSCRLGLQSFESHPSRCLPGGLDGRVVPRAWCATLSIQAFHPLLGLLTTGIWLHQPAWVSGTNQLEILWSPAQLGP